MAFRQLLKLRRSRRRDVLAHDYGQYQLVDQADSVVASGTLADIHAYLVRRHR